MMAGDAGVPVSSVGPDATPSAAEPPGEEENVGMARPSLEESPGGWTPLPSRSPARLPRRWSTAKARRRLPWEKRESGPWVAPPPPLLFSSVQGIPGLTTPSAPWKAFSDCKTFPLSHRPSVLLTPSTILEVEGGGPGRGLRQVQGGGTGASHGAARSRGKEHGDKERGL